MPGEFNLPSAIAVDLAGTVLVTDTWNHRVQTFDANGGFIGAWGSAGAGDGQFWAPQGIATDREGYVYVGDTGNDRVQKFAPVTPVRIVPGATLAPTDTDGDGIFDDVNGNGRRDFADVVLYFNQMTWIAANEPDGLFDCNGYGRIDFADVV